MKRTIVQVVGCVLLAGAAARCGSPCRTQPPPGSCPPAAAMLASAGSAPHASNRSTQLVLAAPERGLLTDEGMWLLEDFPSTEVEKLHGFGPGQQWLDHVRLAAVRLAGGCSGSFVSPSGLVMTNHHCAAGCIEHRSSARKDYLRAGFYAKSASEELKCPDFELDQLVAISDVTDRMTRATRGLRGAAYRRTSQAEQSKIEKECATSDELRCDVVSLYRGGRYHLYRYQRFQDVRLVFAPESAMAFFGGNPDNFVFPRYDFDVSFLRVYRQDRPLVSSEYLRWSASGPKEQELTFVAGHPWGSSRSLTVAELEYLRDVALPASLLRLAQVRGLLTEFQRRGPEPRRISADLLMGVEDGLKAGVGEVAALRDPEQFGRKVAAENQLRARVEADPVLGQYCSGSWQAIREAQKRLSALRFPYRLLEWGEGFWSELFHHARRLVRATTELPKPDPERLREYVDSRRPALIQHILSRAPIHVELEILTLTHALTELREELGPDDPVVRKVLGQAAPLELATRLVERTRLKDVAFRDALFEGGSRAVNSSEDPMIQLARLVDPDARAIRKLYEDQVEAIVNEHSERIALARFRLYGTRVYPDATGTLRLSFGQVRGYQEGGRWVPPFTTLAGAFERATGREPFLLPKRWLDQKSKLDLSTPLDFCTTNDILGGNSGSPVIDRDRRIVGIVFDGNIHSLGGEYAYDAQKGRAVALSSAAILEGLRKVYGAARILDELETAP